MSPLIISSITISLIFLADSWILKSKRKFVDYLGLFFLLSGVQYAFRAHNIDASVFDKYVIEKPGVVLTIESKNKTSRDVKKEFMARCREMMDYHHEEASRYFKCAEDACLLMPADDKEKANWCFSAAIGTLYPGSPAHKIVAGVIALASQYAFAVNLEWQRVDTLLHNAKHHFEMEAHYVMLYNYQVGLLNAEKREEK